jgi:ubiquinone/menaquinone biosynthesis C-methylase UbiE
VDHLTNPDSEDASSPRIIDYEGSTYRTDFWEGRGREYEDLAERRALARLMPPRGRRILDIGAGFGRLANLYDGYEQVILLDYSRSQLEFARQRLGDERFIYVAADIYRLPLATNAVDTTVMVRVLHHLADVPLALQQIARVIGPQGTFVLEFANKRHLKNILAHLIGRGPDPFALAPYEFAQLHFDFHPDWVSQQLREAGFQIEQCLSVSLFRMGLLKRLFAAQFLAAVDGALQAATAPLTLGPSLFTRAHVRKSGPLELAKTEQLFCCPTCGHEPLSRQAQALYCEHCQAVWRIENGIYVFK